MSFDLGLQTFGTQDAGADLSVSQYLAVKLNSAGAVIAASSAGESVMGVLQNNPTSGRAALVAFGGIVMWKAGGVVAPNAKVTTDNTGKCVTAATGNYIRGIAILKANSASGDIIPVLLLGQGVSP